MIYHLANWLAYHIELHPTMLLATYILGAFLVGAYVQ